MKNTLFDRLLPIRRRRRLSSIFHTAVIGLLVGSVAGLFLAFMRWTSTASISTGQVIALLVAGPVVGALIGFFRKSDWSSAAVAVDEHYALKDRAATAVEFSGKSEKTLIHDLQIQDALDHLTAIEPSQVSPLHLPKLFPLAAGLAVMAAVLLAWPLTPPPAQARVEVLPGVAAVIEELEDNLEQLDELAKDEDEDKELEPLLEELREKLDELREPGLDVREALAKLSEMETAIRAKQTQFNVGLVDGELAALGTAMTAADALEGAGFALQESKFDKAAEELEKMELPELSRQERAMLKKKLKNSADSMGEAGLGQLSQATSEMAEGLGEGKGGKFKKGGRKLAAATRKHGKRKKIRKSLNLQLAKLGECKGQCNKNGGPKGLAKRKSNSPSNSWGRSSAGNTEGEKTNIESQRDLQEITGQLGEGPSDVETTHSPEGRQQSARGYKEAYKEYRKLSEEVLESEPIPLGHRQTIRRYFELIRPQNTDGE